MLIEPLDSIGHVSMTCVSNTVCFTSSTRHNIPPGVFQKRSVMHTWFGWLAENVFIPSFHDFCNSTLNRAIKWFLFCLVCLRSETRSGLCTACFIVKIDRFLYVVPDSLPDSICSAQLGGASFKNRLGAYSPRSRAETRFRDAPETHRSAPGGITSIV